MKTNLFHPAFRGFFLALLSFLPWIFSCNRVEKPFPLGIRWKLEKNVRTDGRQSHLVTLTLENTGDKPLTDDGWAMYWNQSPRVLLAIDTLVPVTVRWINGDFYTLKPNPGFRLNPGEKLAVHLEWEGYLIKETDAPLGLYVVPQDGLPQKLQAVHIVPLSTREQIVRGPEEGESFPDPAQLFAAAEIRQVAEDPYPVIPHPTRYTRESGYHTPAPKTKCYVSPGLSRHIAYLKKNWQPGLELVSTPEEATLLLKQDGMLKHPEGYILNVSNKKIELRASQPAGAFYGIVTLLALREQDSGRFPACLVEDQPAYPYRGMHLDVGRNFQSKETVLRLLDQMAAYKMNKLLLYLTEDEGWRIEIKAFPELTSVGARRGHPSGKPDYLQPAYGSGPFPDDPESNGNGFYTQKDFVEILRYASDRHIEIIPEVNFPGHARAAIMAMEKRYQTMKAAGKDAEAEKYRLIDPKDASRYVSAQFYTDNVVCVCQPSALAFYEVVLDEFVDMFAQAGLPLLNFHSGGDEVHPNAWTGSPLCKEYMKDRPQIGNIRNLHADFLSNLLPLFEKRKIQLGGWEEVVLEYDALGKSRINPAFTSKGIVTYIWNNLWGQQDLGYRIANLGYKVVLCPVTNTYFDLAYSNDPREPGLYWAGFVDEKDAFGMMPENLFLSTLQDNMGKPYDTERDFAGMERLKETAKDLLLGVQGQLWSETIKGQKMLEYYYMPKLPALAHRAWEGMPSWAGLANADQRKKAMQFDFSRFITRLGAADLPKIDQAKNPINYRIPPPGIIEKANAIYMNTLYPGLQIRYTLDGTEPTSQSTLYRGPVRPSSGARLRAKCFNALGRGGLESMLTL